MPIGKVKLAFKVNHETKKTSFRRNKECLMKKLEELSIILCGINACAIVCSPFKPQREVWPIDNNAFQNVLNQFISMSRIDQTNKIVNQESYIKQRISKVQKQMMVNREMKMAHADCLSGKVSVADLRLRYFGLVSLTGHKLKEIEERVELLKSEPPAALTVTATTAATTTSGGCGWQ